jgi:hypothetical protein
MDTAKGARRPKTLAIWPNSGWRTVEAMMNELGIQTKWVPLYILVMMAGRLVEMMETSNADMKARRHRAANVPQK